MECTNELKIGDIVVAKMPFSNLGGVKARPALVVGITSWHEVILAMITSHDYRDEMSVPIPRECFLYAPARFHNEIRPASLHTMSKAVIAKKVGHVKPSILKEVQLKMRLACGMS